MRNCGCNCNPCRCHKPRVYDPCVTSNTTTLPPCQAELQCVRNDFQKTLSGLDADIDNTCAVIAHCINNAFIAFTEGVSSGIPDLKNAIAVGLTMLPGYGSGVKNLVMVNGIVQWLEPGGTTSTSTTTTSTTTTMAVSP